MCRHLRPLGQTCPAIQVDVSVSARRVVRVLNYVAQTRGLPQEINCDRGPEFSGQALDQLAHARCVTLDLH